MNKLHKVGQVLVVINILFCFAMAVWDSFENGIYIFISDYFIGGSALTLLLMNFEIYRLVKNKDAKD